MGVHFEPGGQGVCERVHDNAVDIIPASTLSECLYNISMSQDSDAVDENHTGACKHRDHRLAVGRNYLLLKAT